MNIPKYMKMKLITVFTYFASSLFLNLVENKNIDESKNKITTITPNPNTGVSSQITSAPDSVADIHALLDSLKAKNPKIEYRIGVAEAGQYLVSEIKVLHQKLKNLKNDQKEWVSKAEFEERLAYYGLHEGAIAVGEAQDLMDSDKKPEPIRDANVDNANAKAVNSRHKRSQTSKKRM